MYRTNLDLKVLTLFPMASGHLPVIVQIESGSSFCSCSWAVVGADGMLWQVIRCPYYVLTLMGMCPRWLIWLRYASWPLLLLVPRSPLWLTMKSILVVIHCGLLFGFSFVLILPLNHWSLPPSWNLEHCGSAEFKLVFCSYTAFVVLYPVGALYGESKLCLTKHGPQVHQVPHMKQKKNITPNTYSYWTYYVGQAVRLLARWMYVTACDVCERGTWTFSFICVIRSGLVKCSAGDVSIVGAH
jgi:hypothetical protein